MTKKTDNPGGKPDLTKITFPSDSITIGQMRRVEPEWIGAHDLFAKQDAVFSVAALTMATLENDVADHAWRKSAGTLREHEEKNITKAVLPRLDEWYMKYGITTGPAQTRELIRGIQKQAEQLAKESLGQGR